MRKDIDFHFTPHPLTGDLTTKSRSSAINQALKNIVLTNYYERGFNIEVATNIRGSLFELFSPLDAQVLKDNINRAINNFEPMVELIDVYVDTRGDHDIYATIIYTELNDPEPRNVEVLLDRLR